MEMSINYIIATYSGRYRETEDKSEVLQTQLKALHGLIKREKDRGQKPLVEQVTIVCPKPRHQVYLTYYQQEKWIEMFKELGIPVVYLPYVGKNEDHSYDQWIQGYAAFPDFEYTLVMEDDYCIQTSHLSFDKTLVHFYKEKFPKGIGYLATRADNNNGHEYHASISNGMISRKTWEALGDDPLGRYFLMKTIEPYPQLAFSFMFTRSGVDIKDMSNEYDAIFWNSDTKQLTSLSGLRPAERMIVPVQTV